MKKLAVAVTALALSACAAEPQQSTSSAAMGTLLPIPAPGGDWVVTQDWAADAAATPLSPYVGQPVALAADHAIDGAGRTCATPAYWRGQAPAAQVLGQPQQPEAGRDPAPRPVITVTCDGVAFAALVAQPDGSYLTRVNSWVLKLAPHAVETAAVMPPTTPAEPVPPPASSQPEPEAMAAPKTAPVMAPPPATPKHDPRTLVYLASYRTEAQARTGFKVLTKASAILAAQQPITQAVDLGAKGHWVRLYGMATNEAERSTICKQIGRRVDECGARNRE